MSLFFTSLNSGSNGNCYYVGNSNEAVLVDAGISCRETEKRMKRLGLSMQKVKAIFISHEHGDHIKGMDVMAHKYQIPIYITKNTLIGGRLKRNKKLWVDFKAEEPIKIGDMTVHPFSKQHDASDPHSFTIECTGIKVGVFTDVGIVCDNLIKHFKECHAAFLEANYDEQMLEHGGYPLHLKNRIRGGRGHLSNHQALRLFKEHRPPFMSHLFLSHLSKENNDPELVHALFANEASKTNIVIASRYKETDVYTIGGVNQVEYKRKLSEKPAQMSLF